MVLPLVQTLMVATLSLLAYALPPPPRAVRPLRDTTPPVLLKMELFSGLIGPELSNTDISVTDSNGLVKIMKGKDLLSKTANLDVKNKEDWIIYSCEVSDDLSGVDMVSMMATGRNGKDQGSPVEVYFPYKGNQTIDGRWLQGSYTKKQTVSALTATGTWTINFVKVRDNMGNEREYSTEDLRALGFQIDLQVDSENCEAYPWQCSQYNELQTMTRPEAELEYAPPPNRTKAWFEPVEYVPKSAEGNIAMWYQTYLERSNPDLFQYFQIKKERHPDASKCRWQRKSTLPLVHHMPIGWNETHLVNSSYRIPCTLPNLHDCEEIDYTVLC